MAKITPEEISKMAEEIKVFLTDWGLAKDVTLFYNGIRCMSVENADDQDEVLLLSGHDSGDYFWLDDAEELLDELTGGTDKLMRKIEHMAQVEFGSILDRYHVWYEYGNRWNLTCYDEGEMLCYEKEGCG